MLACLSPSLPRRQNEDMKESISENVRSFSVGFCNFRPVTKLKETTRHFVGVPQLQGSYWQMYWTDLSVFVFLCQRHRFVVLNTGINPISFSNATCLWRPSNGNQWPETQGREQWSEGLIKGLTGIQRWLEPNDPKLWERSEWCVCWSFDFFIIMAKLTKPVYTSKRLLLTLDFVVFNHLWGKNGYDLPFGATNSKTVLQGCKCPPHTHKSQPENILCVCRLESHCVPSHRNYVSRLVPTLLTSVSFQDELCSFGAAVSFRNCEESYTIVRHWRAKLETFAWHCNKNQIMSFKRRPNPQVSCWHVFWPVKLVPQRHSKSWLLLSGGSCCWRSAFAQPSMSLGKF